MQGSRIDLKSSWKQSVVKVNPSESRIFGQNKDLPSKFSPARPVPHSSNTSKSLIKHKVSGFSQDQINVGELRDRSNSKDVLYDSREGMKTPRSISERQDGFKGVKMSEKSIDMQGNKMPILKGKSFMPEDADIVKELKLEFLRFKQKILKELRKQEEELKRTIEDIMKIISKNQIIDVSSMPMSEVTPLRPVKVSLPSEIYTPVHLRRASEPVLDMQSNSNVDVFKLRQELSTSRTNYETVVPKIKEKMDKFLDLMSQLKRDINDQTFVGLSPQKYLVEEVQ